MAAQAVPGDSESFRDSIATINKEGKRAWLYPQKPKGPLYNKRTWVSIILLTFLFGTPFIRVNGHPIMLFNVIERKFILFGIPFWPQDFFLFVLAMLTFVVFVILFTVIFGRVWCGWACPQTIFMEMVFRKIEYWIEGDYQQQKALDKAPWSTDKVLKKAGKYSSFFIISFLIANTFLAYIIGIDQLKLLAIDGPFEHTMGFMTLLVFTLVFFLVYTRFREQACIVVCPYGRLQGVLLDRNSMVIAYDYQRGEPRGKIHKKEERKLGDCIDCHQCVNVCPTGIDIRNGTQLECINCTACIDACDNIMDRVGFQKGLIRWASENDIASKVKFRFTARIVGYIAVLMVLFATLVTLLVLRSDVETTVLRTPGQMYQRQEDGSISNLYNIQLVNKTFKDLPLDIRLVDPAGEIRYVGEQIDVVRKDSLVEGVFFIYLNRDQIHQIKTPVVISVQSEGKEIDRVETVFMGPNTKK